MRVGWQLSPLTSHTHIHTSLHDTARHGTALRRRQAPDSKKEEFRKYLEKNGVIDTLTKGKCQVVVCRGSRAGRIGCRLDDDGLGELIG